MTEIEKMAEIIKGIYPDWQEMSAEQLAKHLYENNIRHEAEVRAETAREFAEKVNRKAEIEGDSDFNISIYNLESLTKTIAAEFGVEGNNEI